MTRRRTKVSNLRLQELLVLHGRDFEAIGKKLCIAARTVLTYACEAGLLVHVPKAAHGRQAKSLEDRDAAVERPRDEPWDVDWSEAPIAKRYGTYGTRFHKIPKRERR